MSTALVEKTEKTKRQILEQSRTDQEKETPALVELVDGTKITKPWWPKIETGMIVHHWRGPTKPESPRFAFVTAVYPLGKVSLASCSPNSRTFDVMDLSAVPHVDDPRPESPHIARYGHWDLRDEDKRAAERLEDLEDRVCNLEAALAAKK